MVGRLGIQLQWLPVRAPDLNLADSTDDSTGTGLVERVPDPAVPGFGAEWDLAWKQNLLARAMEQIRPRLDGQQFQAFDLYVNKGWRPAVSTALRKTAKAPLLRFSIVDPLNRGSQRLKEVSRTSPCSWA
jgi:hypothetical protein